MTVYRKMETFPTSTSATDGKYLICLDQDQSNQILLISRFLLDFKREFNYPHVYRVWETIWAAGHVASPQFGLFIALSLVETYRDIIIDR